MGSVLGRLKNVGFPVSGEEVCLLWAKAKIQQKSFLNCFFAYLPQTKAPQILRSVI